jgi:hypothetical protein
VSNGNSIILWSPEEAISAIVDAFSQALETFSEIRIRIDQMRERIRIKVIIAGTVIEYHLEAAANAMQDWIVEIQEFVDSLLGG